MSRVRSLKQYLLLYAIGFLALVTIAGGMGGYGNQRQKADGVQQQVLLKGSDSRHAEIIERNVGLL